MRYSQKIPGVHTSQGGETIRKDNRIDTTDLLLLDALQDDLPLTPRPWQAIGEQIGVSEEECLQRISRLSESGVIRNISPVLESRKFGLNAGTLIAFHIPEERIDEVAAIINSYPEVSHNYRRDHHYSIWFTIAGRSNEEIERVIEEIQTKAGIPDEDMISLPTIRSYKIDVRFRCIPEGSDG